MAKTVTQPQLNRMLGCIGIVITLILIVAAAAVKIGANFADRQVRSQLVQEKITFPPAGSAALNPQEFPGLQQYGGQAVDNGSKAKAYADEFIWQHMMKASGGQTYAQVSTAAQANPNDQKLAALKTTLFQGDMLRSSLLTAYAFSVFGRIAGLGSLILLLGGVLLGILSLLALARASRR